MNIHIPTYEELIDKRRQEMNPVEAFVFDHEPFGKEEYKFRADLHSLIEYVLRKEGK